MIHSVCSEKINDLSNNVGSCDIFCLISEPLSSVSSLEVHFDLLDLTELTDMSDQELGEVFADSDEENHTESPASESHQTYDDIYLGWIVCKFGMLPWSLHGQ